MRRERDENREKGKKLTRAPLEIRGGELVRFTGFSERVGKFAKSIGEEATRVCPFSFELGQLL